MNKLLLDQSRRQKTQLWSSVVSILLIDGNELLSMDDNGFSDPYVKFKLGNERYKSRVGVGHLIYRIMFKIAARRSGSKILITRYLESTSWIIDPCTIQKKCA